MKISPKNIVRGVSAGELILKFVGTNRGPLQVGMFPKTIKEISSEIMEENKARVPVIRPEKCCDTDEGKVVGDGTWKRDSESCRIGVGNC